MSESKAKKNAYRLVRRLRDSSGQSIVEAAIITPLLLLSTFAVVDFGVLFHANLALENGVAMAARYGITGAMMDGKSREESIMEVMRSSTPTLTLDDDAFHFSHLSGGHWIDGAGGPGEIEKVTVTYTHDMIVLTPFLTDGEVTLRVESSMKNEDRFE
jgi:hypothetical protein